MEFCQLQLNYIDWTFQDGQAKRWSCWTAGTSPSGSWSPCGAAAWPALPTRRPPPLRAMRPEEPIPAWAFRFLQSIPSVTVILSGMSDLEQVKANIATFQMEDPLSSREMERLLAHGPAHGQQDRPALHRLPLLRQPLSPGAGYPLPAGAVQRALPSPAAASWPPWPSLPCRRTSSPAPASAAAAARRSVPSRLKISEAMADFASRL